MEKRKNPLSVQKRDRSIVRFNPNKIETAIRKAAREILQDEDRSALIGKRLAGFVVQKLRATSAKKPVPVEAIQDVVETVLMEEGYGQIAKAYILYREKRSALRTAKSAFGMKDDLKLPLNTMEVLQKRYLLRDDRQNIIETPGGLFRRVASHVAQAERNFQSSLAPAQVEEIFYRIMRNLEFLPNSPTLMNAGGPLGQLSACFVIPVQDSIDGIFDALKSMAKIHQSGGGTGFSFSRLRPKNDLVSTTKGEASGPVSFMSIFDKATEVIVQGGKRRGANMGILRCDHPDIVDFIEAKVGNSRFSNFNLSVGITDRFMKAVAGHGEFDLVNPRTQKKVKSVRARTLFDLIVNAAWLTGDPGLIFLDEINRRNPTPGVGRIEATNPCGELPLLPYESCNLGSINLAKMLQGKRVDWEKLRQTVHAGVRFLDDVVEVNRYPLPQIRDVTLGNRKIGLGVMGFADMLIRLGIPYQAREAAQFARKLMRFIHDESLRSSVLLAKERGVFPNYPRSIYAPKNMRLRNATVNTVAPTGTISIIAGCSSGIEPLFAVSFVRNVLSGTQLLEINPIFEELAKSRGFYNRDLVALLARSGSIQGIKGIPADIKKIFVTTFDISPPDHLEIQAAFQTHTDNSVSKTVNLPSEATVEDVRRIYLAAYQKKCKGITIYRYGSKKDQVLALEHRTQDTSPQPAGPLTVESDFAGGCTSTACLF